jgi:glycosyltransferase involved in cell wall biosynthesis
LGDPLPNAEVAWNPYNVSSEPSPDWPAETGIWRLACVARIDVGAKGQDLLLQILARPEWRSRPIELSFFGEGSHELALRRVVEALQLENVHFRGHVSDIRTIWKQNHLLTLPSRYEGLPLALVEAMWCARPAVVTDVGGNAELCLDNETGFVAPAANVSSFALALERAWDRRKDWVRMGQKARARVDNLVPKDPVGVFCNQLKACVAAKQSHVSAQR